ncbi:MAG: hypothetical protein HY851_02310 [candidate division Zixibacteria bacterium]|nr:hypothetical protein [candidate division Zixibacteria bacterium]
MRRLARTVSISICLLFPTVVSASIQSLVFSAFDYVQSARANAMGGCVITNVDEEAALYNPGAMGVFHLNRAMSLTIPIRTTLMPEFSDDTRVSALSASGRIPARWLGQRKTAPSKFSLSAGFSQLKLQWSYYSRWYGITMSGYYERASNFTIAAGYQNGARIGLGLTYKHLKAVIPAVGAGSQVGGTFSSTGWAYDLGLYADIDLADLHGQRQAAGGSRFSLVPAIAFVRANAGGDHFAYLDVVQEDPLPEMNRYSFSIKIVEARGSAEIKSLRLVYEREDWMVPYHKDKVGAELGLLGALFIRAGYLGDGTKYLDLFTYGGGFSFAGLSRWLREGGNRSSNQPASNGFWERLDLKIDYSRYGSDDTQFQQKTTFFKLCLSM